MDLNKCRYKERLEKILVDPAKFNKAVAMIKHDFPCFELADRKRTTLADALLECFEVVGASETRLMFTQKHLKQGEKRNVYTL